MEITQKIPHSINDYLILDMLSVAKYHIYLYESDVCDLILSLENYTYHVKNITYQ